MNMRNVATVVAMLLLALHKTECAVYVVGGGGGWQNPSNSTHYASWASSHNFSTGDILMFNFVTGVHDVATVTMDAYDNCNTANPLNIINNGPTNVTLNTTGMHYYICTFPGHCSTGQKLAVNVGGTSSSPPLPPGTTVTPPPPPPPPAGSASSNIVANFVLMFMSIAVGFLCC
ncbi:hypothetical protein JCGZ_13353 [Jatropha curcas]|uniref:Phytocyanin domain-containing protein n=1 Tax=Jatropha curcas TaxID=180498 RepID=A0A067KBN2_JATCU|nr:umecyanin [Jatropha curcas]KDP32428.1 hypothetical protein JCGZ_13353 [Jatropha curcas]